MPFVEDLIVSGNDITTRLLAGYTCDFQTQGDYSEITGLLSIDSGTVEVSNVELTSIPTGTIPLSYFNEVAVTLNRVASNTSNLQQAMLPAVVASPSLIRF